MRYLVCTSTLLRGRHVHSTWTKPSVRLHFGAAAAAARSPVAKLRVRVLATRRGCVAQVAPQYPASFRVNALSMASWHHEGRRQAATQGP